MPGRGIRRAKIICTLGPSTSSEEGISGLIDAGMNVARLNFSHGSHDSHRELYQRVRDVAKRKGQPIAIMQDLQGPRVRLGVMAEGTVLTKGETFTLVRDEIEGNAERSTTTLRELFEDVEPGERILIADGRVHLRITEVGTGRVTTRVEVGGPIHSKAG
ncbi:MAG: pyruvate kinase, partial [Myxococcales bacterium]|nr:pyruvate kinase [Myxococcales bacterium]